MFQHLSGTCIFSIILHADGAFVILQYEEISGHIEAKLNITSYEELVADVHHPYHYQQLNCKFFGKEAINHIATFTRKIYLIRKIIISGCTKIFK